MKQSLETKFKKFDKVFFYLKELCFFIRFPKRYINSIIQKNNDEIVKRVLFYYIFFFIILISIATYILPKTNINKKIIIVIILLDIILSLPNVLIISLSLLIVGIDSPLRKSFSYFFITKSFLMFLPSFFHILFVSYENYFFAIFRTISIYFLIFVIYFGSGILFGKNFKKKFKIVFFNLIFLLFFILLSNIILFNSRKDVSINQDPIFNEFQKLFKEINIVLENPYQKKIEEIVDEHIKFLIEQNEFVEFSFYDLKKFFDNYYSLKIDVETVTKKITGSEFKLQFQLNKKIKSIYKDYLDLLITLLEQYGDLMTSFYYGLDHEKINNFFVSANKLKDNEMLVLKKANYLLKKISSYFIKIEKLHRYYLLL